MLGFEVLSQAPATSPLKQVIVSIGLGYILGNDGIPAHLSDHKTNELREYRPCGDRCASRALSAKRPPGWCMRVANLDRERFHRSLHQAYSSGSPMPLWLRRMIVLPKFPRSRMSTMLVDLTGCPYRAHRRAIFRRRRIKFSQTMTTALTPGLMKAKCKSSPVRDTIGLRPGIGISDKQTHASRYSGSVSATKSLCASACTSTIKSIVSGFLAVPRPSVSCSLCSSCGTNLEENIAEITPCALLVQAVIQRD